MAIGDINFLVLRFNNVPDYFVIGNLTEFYNLSVPNYTRHREVIQTIAISLLAATLLVIASELWQLVRESKNYQYTLGAASGEFQRILY